MPFDNLPELKPALRPEQSCGRTAISECEKAKRQVLLDAARIIEERGLLRGAMGEKGGQRCALGAIFEAAGSVEIAAPAYRLFTSTLGGKFIGEWSDTTPEDRVIAAMRAAAAEKK